MMFVTADLTEMSLPASSASTGSLMASSRMRGRGSLFDVLRRQIHELKVGETIYRLYSPTLALFYPAIHGTSGKLMITPSGLHIFGTGVGLNESLQDWSDQFHVRFQTLLAKRPWEMTVEEKDEWKLIERMVNVEAYRRETPYRVRQIGTVSQRRPTASEPRALPNQILWESGQKESLRLDIAPPELASYFAGKRFEAIVLRDSFTHKMIKILDVIPLGALPNTAQCDELWNAVPTTKDLSMVEWDQYD